MHSAFVRRFRAKISKDDGYAACSLWYCVCTAETKSPRCAPGSCRNVWAFPYWKGSGRIATVTGGPVFFRCSVHDLSGVQYSRGCLSYHTSTGDSSFLRCEREGKINGSVNEMIYFSFNEVYNKRKLWACVFSFIKMPDWTSVYLLGGVMWVRGRACGRLILQREWAAAAS